MRVSDLHSWCDRSVPLTPRSWAWATLLGKARTESNNSSRHRASDRGQQNSQVDLLGSLGELFLLARCGDAEGGGQAVDFMRDHLFNSAGGRGVDGPDLQFTCSSTNVQFEVDVKTFDCSPYKRLFAINDQKHRSLEGRCDGYFCVITPPLGRSMAISKLVPYEDVERWSVAALGRYGSPSRNCPLDAFLRRYFSRPPSIPTLRDHVFAPEDVGAACADPDVRAGLRALVPNLPV